MNSSRSGEETLWEALCWVLRASRICGAAPLNCTTLPAGCRIRYSRAVHHYSILLSVALCIGAFVATVLDVVNGWISIFPVIIKLLLLCNFATTFGYTLIACCTGLTRVTNVARYFEELSNLSRELRSYQPLCVDDSKGWRVIKISLIGICTASVTEYTIIQICEKKSSLMSVFYIAYYIMYLRRSLTVLQFSLTFDAVHLSQKKLSTCIKGLVKDTRTAVKPRDIPTTSYGYIVMRNNYITPLKSINHVIDTLGFRGIFSDSSIKSSQDIIMDIHHLSSVHRRLQGVIGQVIANHGKQLLVILISLLTHLVMLLCFSRVFITGEMTLRNYSFLGMYAIWMFVDINMIMSIVEPCHQILQDMANTKVLVGQMVQEAASTGCISVMEMELFFRHISSNQMGCCPMAMVTLNRGLYITMINAITTYLIILLQL